MSAEGFDPSQGYGSRHRRGRLNRSRVVAAGTSVSALVALTAGVAAANPAPSNQSQPAAGRTTNRSPNANDNRGRDDSGWTGGSDDTDRDGRVGDPGDSGSGSTDPGYTDPGYSDPGYSDPGYTDPNGSSGFSGPSSSFDPGYSNGGGQSRSGGS
ncbi:MAG: hypothetical protein ACXVK4_14535 [Acidimicrobiia bacterium]